jgi:hypothetical protein
MDVMNRRSYAVVARKDVRPRISEGENMVRDFNNGVNKLLRRTERIANSKVFN